MKTISKEALSKGNFAAPLCHTLKNNGAGISSDSDGKLRSGLTNHHSVIIRLPSAAKRNESTYLNDAVVKQETALSITHEQEMEYELKELRYRLERNIELRTRQLTKRITLLESCNTNLCNKLALTLRELATLRQPSAEHAIVPDQTIQPIPAIIAGDSDEQIHGIGDWAGWRVAAADAIA